MFITYTNIITLSYFIENYYSHIVICEHQNREIYVIQGTWKGEFEYTYYMQTIHEELYERYIFFLSCLLILNLHIMYNK